MLMIRVPAPHVYRCAVCRTHRARATSGCHPARGTPCAPARLLLQRLGNNSTCARVSSRKDASTAGGASDQPVVDPTRDSAASTYDEAGVEERTDEAPGVAGQGGKSDEYSKEMQSQMGTVLTYRHEDGMNFNRVLPDLIVGSCLQTPSDVDRLAEQEGVTTVFSLQEDCDMEYFDIDVSAIQERCKARGDIRHVRFPVRDFDPFDLRNKLPKAVSKLARTHDPASGAVYIHCTAGLGRAPATAVAYMTWVRGIQVDAANAQVKSVRTCTPKMEAIRSATADLLLGLGPVPATLAVYRHECASSVQVAGLDVGWNQLLDLEWNRSRGRFELNRPMLPGLYQFKMVLDGSWSYSADHPTVPDGAYTNNVLEVTGDMPADAYATLRRILTPGANLTQDEQAELLAMLCPWKTHGPRAEMPLGWSPLESGDADHLPLVGGDDKLWLYQ